MKLLATLLNYQLDDAKQIRKFKGRALLALEQGLGKSIVSLYYYYKTKKNRPVLIICPATIKFNWADELFMHFGESCDILSGRKTPKHVEKNHAQFIIINYNILHNWIPYLQQLDIQGIIMDECHYIKNKDSIMGQAVQTICKDVKSILGLSGTPITNGPTEFFNILNILHPDKFPSFWKFANRYTYPKLYKHGWVYRGSKNIKELYRILGETCCIRRLKKNTPEAAIPRKRRKIVHINLPLDSEYRKANRRFLPWVRRNKSICAAVKAKKALAITKRTTLRMLTGLEKIPFVIKWTHQWLEENLDKKLILFAIHKEVISQIQKEFKKICVVVDGDTKDKPAMVKAFQTNSSKRLFIGNLQAAGVGLNLTASHTVGMVEIPWKPSDLKQGEDRVHRFTQTSECTIYYFIMRETIEPKQLKLIREKQKITNAALDGTIDYLDDFDIFKRLAR